jgi:hypothetical protein
MLSAAIFLLAEMRPLFPDLTDDTSDLSTAPGISLGAEKEPFGLSDALPRTLEPSEDLNDREDPWVSDLPKDGRDASKGPARSRDVAEALFRGLAAPELLFDG